MNRHIIHKQKTIVKISRQERSTVFQAELSDMYKNEIPQLLETVFDEIAGENEIIRIDTLRLDLGALPADNFKQEFKTQLAEQLKKIITEKKAEHVFRNSSDVVVIKKEQSLQETFKHFLQYGTKPWFNAAKTLQQWEAEMLNNFSQQQWQNISTWLKKNFDEQPVILERLIQQFSDEVLVKILKELSSFNEAEWRVMYNDLTALYTVFLLQQKNIRTNVWYDSFVAFLQLQKKHTNPLYEPVSAIFQQYYKNTATTEYLKAVQYISTIIIEKETVEEINKEEQSSKQDHPEREQLKNLKGKIYSNIIIDAINEIKEDTIKIAGQLLQYETKSQQATDKDDSTDLIRSKANAEVSDEFDADNISDNTHSDKSTLKDQDAITDEQAKAINEQDKLKREKENDQAKKLKQKKKAKDAIEGEIQYVINSGIIILHPFLLTYFHGLGLIKEKKFIDIDACKRAVLLLHFLATGETSIAEFDLLLQKLICNLLLEETLPAVLEITDKEIEESEKLLLSVINYWPPLKNTSIAGLRNTFLDREGRLEKKENGWRLTIEQRTVDILLDKLPWGFSTIRLPWMNEMLSVDWC